MYFAKRERDLRKKTLRRRLGRGQRNQVNQLNLRLFFLTFFPFYAIKMQICALIHTKEERKGKREKRKKDTSCSGEEPVYAGKIERGNAKERSWLMAKEKKEIEPSENKVYQNIRTVLVAARQKVYSVINSAMVEAYWDIGRQIIEAQEGQRAEYGTGLIKYLAERLTKEFGKGFTETNLRYMRQFSSTFPIRHALRDELSWTHYRLLMRIDNEPRREFYMKECAECNWSSRQLERQIPVPSP